MQRHISYLIPFLLLFIAFSCKKESGNPVVEDPKPTGVPTQMGVPTGEQSIEKNIGAEGGTITSADGRLKVIIPAGALSSSRAIGIQPVTNFNPLAIGDAYRLLPHDVSFAKPAAIEFTYNDEDIQNTIPEALGIAYQDSNKIWQARGGAALDKTNKKVTVTTNHFSDWSLFESIYLKASGTVAPVNGTIELEVFTTDDLIVPLDPAQEIPMGRKKSMAVKYIKEWKLAGAGKLQTGGADAIYTAPSTVPSSPNPVAVSVSVDLKKRGQFLLVRHIEIVDDDGEIEVRVAGSGWVKKTASVAVKDENGFWIIGDSDGDTQGSYVLIMVPDALGTHPYRSPEATSGTYAHYLVTGINNYVCQYMDEEDNLVASGGGVTLTSLGEEDGFLKGTFTATPAGNGDNLEDKINLEGKFRVRKAPVQ